MNRRTTTPTHKSRKTTTRPQSVTTQAGILGNANPIRTKIEALSASLSLPTARRALGLLEGEHRSSQRFGSADTLGARDYTLEDEARLIDWKVSARAGRPMVTDHERLVTSTIHLLADTGVQMNGTCPTGESAWAVATNALCMFAALSARRHDALSLVLANSATITRMACRGGLAQFEHTLDTRARLSDRPGNLGALLDYASTHLNDKSTIVVATDEHSLEDGHLQAIRRIASRHPLILVTVGTLNPFSTEGMTPHAHVASGSSGRRIPAFMRTGEAAAAYNAHQTYLTSQFDRELKRCGALMITASGSEAMLNQFVRLLSLTRNHTVSWGRQSGSSFLPVSGGGR